MTADRYRWNAFEAQRHALEATTPSARAEWEMLSREWLALAEQGDWLAQRYGPLASAERAQPVPLLQQQQIQPKKE